MPGMDILFAFGIATLVFGYMPGPGMLYATARTLAGGWQAGLRAALGLHIGGYLHVFAAGFGLALVFQAIPTLYLVLKFAGAAYLIWLGVQLWRTPAMPEQPLVEVGYQGAFWQSITVEALNPKTAVFYLAFLPQFTDPVASLPIWAQMLVLGTVVNVIFSSADVMCVMLAGKLQRSLQRSARAAALMRRAGGGLLMALGVHLGLARG